MSDIPHCVGPESPEAGLAPGCAGCPNASLCASGAGRLPDPDIPLINARLHAVRHVVLVMSGKGGVGKSTVTKELAFALADRGFRVGLLDTDLCGPSLPRLVGGREEDCHRSSTGIEPVWLSERVCLMSSYYLLSPEEKNEALLIRGSKKTAMIKLFLKDVEWGSLDYLLMDTPPGTSDEHLTLASALKLPASSPSSPPAPRVSGVVMVTTPQRVAEADVRRELTFCQKAQFPVLGIIENMSGFVCPHCHHTTEIFPTAAALQPPPAPAAKGSAGERLSAEFGVPLLGRLPIDPLLMKSCELGKSLMDYLMDLADKEEEEEGGGEGSTTTSTASVEALFAIADRIVSMLDPPKYTE